MPVRSIVNQIENFKKIFNKDVKDFNNSLANKERTLKQLENDLIRMISSFTKSVGEIFPQDLLSYKEDNLLEESSFPKIVKKKEVMFKSHLSESFLNVIKINIHKEWSLSIKTLAALRDLDIIHVGDLISYEKEDLLKARNFGNKSLEELTDYMALYDLNFGTNIKDWNLIRSSLDENNE
jgi:DNA-directed RNA polymerase subunit alpha